MRVGNGAYDQRQHDVWGAMLDSIFLHTKSARPPARASLAADQAPRRERDRALAASPTAGIREVRGEAQHFAPEGHVLGGAATAAPGWPGCERTTSRPTSGSALADEIKADILEHGCDGWCLHPALRDRRAGRLGAADPLVRFLPPEDERVRNTVMAIADA